MSTKLQNLLLVLISIGITVGLGELAFRVMLPTASSHDRNGAQPLERLIEFDTKLLTRYRPNVSSLVKSQYGEFEIKYSTNSYGLRDRPLESDDSKRILVLGNSLVEGWGVEEEDGFLRVTEQNLNASRTRPVRLINGGISGYGAAQGYLLGSELMEKLKPNAIVFVYMSTMVQADFQFLSLANKDINNLATGLSGDALLKSPSPTKVSDSTTLIWLNTAAKYSAMAKFFQQILDSRAAIKAIQPGNPNTDLLAGLRADGKNLAAVHAPSLAHINGLAQRAKEKGVPFIMIHLPMPHQLSPDEWIEGRKAYGLESKVYPSNDIEVIQIFCQENRISCTSAHVDLSKIILDDPDKGKYFYKLDFHPTAIGYRAIGLWMATELKKIGL